MAGPGALCSLLAALILAAGAFAAGESRAAPVARPDSAWTHEAFQLPGLDGARHVLAEWKGKVIMLNFWATWCAPCQAEIADFVAFQDQYGGAGLQIVGVGLDAEKKLRNVQRTLEINYPILVADPERNALLMKQWGNTSGIVPYTVVIDRDGGIAYTQRGPLHRDVFEERVLPLLGNGEEQRSPSRRKPGSLPFPLKRAMRQSAAWHLRADFSFRTD